MSEKDLAGKLNSGWIKLGETLGRLNYIKGDGMKTVKDAYDCYGKSILDRGNWSCIGYNLEEDRFMDFLFLISDGWVSVCTRQEFKDYAEIQKLNSINKGLVKNQKYTIKDAFNYYKYNVSKKKDATYIVCNIKDGSFNYIDNNKALSGDFYIIGSIDDFKLYEKSIANDEVKQVAQHNKESAAISTLENLGYTHNGGALWKPPIGKSESIAAKPVYTQEMADNGEFPKVGCKCLLVSMGLTLFNKEVEITYIGDGVGCYKDTENEMEYSFASESTIFKPIDARTDEEKLVDDLIQGAALTRDLDKKLIAKILEGYKIIKEDK